VALPRAASPHGMVTLLAGREGIGKSTVALDLAARLTRGTLDRTLRGQAAVT
jgi:predicted ATP-dependent serine protease